MICENTDFTDAIIDNEVLSYLHINNARNIPLAIIKEELRNQLEKRGFDEEKITSLLKYSSSHN
jgi:hypothetical protein